MLILAVTAAAAAVNCTDVFSWQYACDDPQLSDWDWAKAHCSADNSWDQPCAIYADVQCDGARNFTRKQWCPNRNGKHYGTAVLLSFFFGPFGFDRFYLGYHSIGVIKLCTGGIFFIGWAIDCILITLQIVGPGTGEKYAAAKPFPLLMCHPHHDIL
jgi:TM2 domain-containing membrane protein YozV